MSVTRMSRTIPGIRKVLSLGNRTCNGPTRYALMRPSCHVRHFYRGGWGRDGPFAQMEEFMKDIERKFKRDIDSVFRDLPRVVESTMSRVPEVKPRPRFGDIEDVSTPETYKLAFNFPNAKPEDVKVSLKGHTLTVTGSAEEISATSRSSRQISVEYELPEDINVDALESSMSHEGILTIEAPRALPEAPEAPRPIDIHRE